MISRRKRLAALEADIFALDARVNVERVDDDTVRLTFGKHYPALIIPREAIPQEGTNGIKH